MRSGRAAWATVMLPVSFMASAAQPPGFRLGDIAAPVAYEWRLAIDPKEATFTGEVRIEIEVRRPTPVLWLNATALTIESVEVRQADRRVDATATVAGEEHVGIELRGESFAPGAMVVTLRYRGPIEPVSTRGIFRQQEGGEWYVVSQFEAISARRAVPCFDEPGWKTPWRLTIDAPEGNQVVSNTREAMVSDAPGRKGWKRHDFATTKPLPSYLIALAVGPFDVVDGGTAGVRKTPLRHFTPKGRGAEARYVRESTPRILELVEKYFGRPYPFDKLDSLVIPQAVGFGAMENVGLITYSADLIMATPREETPSFRRRYAATAAHEIAHMWFGNLVTLAWWDDIWLNEAFATWIEQKITPQFHPEWDNGVSVGFSRKRSIAADRLASARRIRNPVVAKTDIEGAFDGITYQKGAAVISMFEGWFGAETFRAGVRHFLEKHEFGSATSDDFMRAIGESAAKGEAPLRMFRAFLDQPGVPLVDVALQCQGNAARVDTALARLRPVGSAAQEMRWTTPACFRFGRGGRPSTQCAELPNGASRVSLAGGGCPDWVMANADGHSHYVPRYDAALSRKLREHMNELPANGMVALMLDAGFLSDSGLMPVDEAIAWADAALAHPSPIVRQHAVDLLEKQRDAWLTPAQARAKHEVVDRRVMPLARELGWLERSGESEETKLLRVTLLPFAAQREEGGALRGEARRLALAWVADREAVPATMTRAVLETAGRFADEATYLRLEDRMISVQDARERLYLISALAKVRDPALRKWALEFSIPVPGSRGAFAPRDSLTFLEEALKDESNRGPALDFVRANFDAIAKKLPHNTVPYLMTYAGQLCSREDRSVFVTAFKDRAAQFEGGALRYRQALETLELCVAAHGPPA
ncbi:MAG TPA: M1 family metallopeptidase [Usitatibacter sp.]|nr:M1 family metallopeptidase [Usitatibacter sp.]